MTNASVESAAEIASLRGRQRGERVILGAVAAAAAGLLALFCSLPDNRLVDYLSDDAYYYFKVARYIAEGQGPTFDGITLTTGFHPLYAFILAGLQKGLAPGEYGLVRFALVFNAACCVMTGWLILMAARRLWGDSAGRWGAIFWFSNPHALLLVATGMEGSLYAFCVAAYFALLSWSHGNAARRAGWLGGTVSLGLLCGLCVVARTDALLLVLLSAACILAPGLVERGRYYLRGADQSAAVLQCSVLRDAARAAVFLAFAMVPFIAWLLYAEHYTGTFVQASAQMKQLWRQQLTADMGLCQRFLFSADIFVNWIVKSIVKVPALKYLLVFAGALAADLALRRAQAARSTVHMLWVFPVLLGLAYSVGFPKTWTWYFAPGLVTLSMLAAGCMSIAAQRAFTGRCRAHVKRWLPLLLVVASIESYGYLASKGIRGRNRNQRDMYAVALWIRGNLPADARLAAWNAGIYGWYSGRTVINLDGLINNEIAGLYKQSHSVGDYLLRRKVQYLVDEAAYLPKFMPEWGDRDYSVIYRHDSRHTVPIAVWKISGSQTPAGAGLQAAPRK